MSSAYLPFFLKLAATAKFCGPGSLNLIPYPCHVCSCSLRVQDRIGCHPIRKKCLETNPAARTAGYWTTRHKTLHQAMSLLVLCSSLHPGSHRT
ncbi:hypothetical protein D6D08_07119 [Aureobasidium pullulans]|nr:hypothetical protein D6D08_07119 [Aureobasidium pullulans]